MFSCHVLCRHTENIKSVIAAFLRYFDNQVSFTAAAFFSRLYKKVRNVFFIGYVKPVCCFIICDRASYKLYCACPVIIIFYIYFPDTVSVYEALSSPASVISGLAVSTVKCILSVLELLPAPSSAIIVISYSPSSVNTFSSRTLLYCLQSLPCQVPRLFR